MPRQLSLEERVKYIAELEYMEAGGQEFSEKEYGEYMIRRQRELLRGPLPVIKEEITPDREAQSDTAEEEMVQVRKADWAPKLTCIGCNGFYRGSVKYCKNNHGVCSTCLPGDKKQCPVRGCGQNAIVTLDILSELVKDLKFAITCKFKKNGCDKEDADEEVITDHEIECGYRKVPCFRGCPDQLAMNFEAHIFSAHGDVYGIHRDNLGKWILTTRGNATKMWIDSGTGHGFRCLRFWAGLYHDDENKQWRCSTTVFGGKNVAKKFRAEMRLSSYDGDTSVVFNGNVYCLDDRYQQDASKEFRIDDGQFRIHNKGRIELGDHNKDKNGELTLPVTLKVKMKKLNVP